jgi:hypothetical protein
MPSRDWGVLEDPGLEDDEIAGGRGRMYPDVRGVIVVVYHHGFPVQQDDTWQEVMGELYSELTVRNGQCV